MKRVYPFLALVALAAVVSFGISSWSHREQSLPRPCSLGSLSDYLSLTPEQQRKIEPAFTQFTKERSEVVRRRDEATRKLVSVLRSDDSTKQQIQDALRAVDVQQSQLRNLTAHHLLSLKSVLDKKQKAKLFDLVNRRACVSDGQGSLACPVAKP